MDVDSAIVARKTTKALSSVSLPAAEARETIQQLVDLAGWAPFHRPCDASHQGDLDGIVPWRMHIFDADNCRRLREHLPSERAGKIPAMLASALAMIYTTWLPNQPSGELAPGQLYEPTLANMEHIAAASAAVQNLLLAATARSIDNYWSSGGALLREPGIATELGIERSEILLGAIFLFPSEQEMPSSETLTRAESKLRPQRPSSDRWSRWVNLG